jgi:large subunit ribosomal protein L10
MRDTVRPEKVAKGKELKTKLESTPAFILTGYSGLTVSQLTTLRSALKKEGAECHVYKNTTARKVLVEIGQKEMADGLVGPTAMILSGADPVAPAKILVKFIKDNEKMTIKGGVVEKKAVDDKAIVQLSKLPSREVLIAKVVGGIKSPLYGLVNVLSGPTRKLVYAVEAIRKQKGGE